MEANATVTTDDTKEFVCNMTISGKIFQLRSNDPSHMPSYCDPEYADAQADGAAMYAIVTISVFATAIGLFIAMLSFKKKKYDEWDSQAGDYLGNLYERRLMEEKRVMSKQAQSVIIPHLGIIQLINGMASAAPKEQVPNKSRPRSKSTPDVHAPNGIEMNNVTAQSRWFNNPYTNMATNVTNGSSSICSQTWTPQHAPIPETDNEGSCCLEIGDVNDLSTEPLISQQSQSTVTELLSRTTSNEAIEQFSPYSVTSPLEQLNDETKNQTLMPNLFT